MPLPPTPHPHLSPVVARGLRGLFWLALLTLAVAAWHYHASAGLPYNAEGRYFDAAEGIVYLEQAVEFWGFVLVVAAWGVIGSLWWLKKPPSSRFLP